MTCDASKKHVKQQNRRIFYHNNYLTDMFLICRFKICKRRLTYQFQALRNNAWPEKISYDKINEKRIGS